jgi:putative endopeptidase
MKVTSFNLSMIKLAGAAFALAAFMVTAAPLAPPGPEPPIPAFSISYLDRSVDPAVNFYSFADGQWVKDNPVPADKARWGGFMQLAERN